MAGQVPRTSTNNYTQKVPKTSFGHSDRAQLCVIPLCACKKYGPHLGQRGCNRPRLDSRIGTVVLTQRALSTTNGFKAACSMTKPSGKCLIPRLFSGLRTEKGEGMNACYNGCALKKRATVINAISTFIMSTVPMGLVPRKPFKNAERSFPIMLGCHLGWCLPVIGTTNNLLTIVYHTGWNVTNAIGWHFNLPVVSFPNLWSEKIDLRSAFQNSTGILSVFIQIQNSDGSRNQTRRRVASRDPRSWSTACTWGTTMFGQGHLNEFKSHRWYPLRGL